MDTSKSSADTALLATNIHRLSSVLGRVADRALQAMYGCGMAQFKILWILNKHQEGVLQTSIAAWLDQTEAAVSRQIHLLKADGLIEQRVDPENRRNHIINLSTKGKRLADEAMQLLVNEYKPLFASLKKEEQHALSAMCEKVFTTTCIKLGKDI